MEKDLDRSCLTRKILIEKTKKAGVYTIECDFSYVPWHPIASVNIV